MLYSGKLLLGLPLQGKSLEDHLYPYTPVADRGQVPCVPLAPQSAASLSSPAACPQGNTNRFPGHTRFCFWSSEFKIAWARPPLSSAEDTSKGVEGTVKTGIASWSYRPHPTARPTQRGVQMIGVVSASQLSELQVDTASGQQMLAVATVPLAIHVCFTANAPYFK